MSKLDIIDDQDFKKIVLNSSTYSDVRKAIGYTQYGVYPNILIQKRMHDLNIQFGISNDNIKIPKQEYSIQNVFIKDSSYLCTDHLKKKIMKYNLMPYKCSCCGNDGTWNNKKLSLQLHHINGIRTDNRLQNLCFLCPNCHSQTDNFSRKGQRRANSSFDENAQRLYSADLNTKVQDQEIVQTTN